MRKFTLIALLSIFYISQLKAQSPGTIDSSFGTNGFTTLDFSTGNESVYGVAIQPDGKSIAVGSTGMLNFTSFMVSRHNEDGTIDNSFGTNGIVATLIDNKESTAWAAVLQPDGKIVVTGEVWNGNFADFATIRYNSDGTLDSSFGVNGIAITSIGEESDIPNCISLQPDGKLLIGGYSKNISSGLYEFALIRLNSDGSLDNSFDSDGTVTMQVGPIYSSIRSIALQPDGKIIATGYSMTDTQYYKISTTRFNSDGTLDQDFGNDGVSTISLGDGSDDGRTVLLQPDGKIIVTGYSYLTSSYLTCSFFALRMDSNGSLDNSFGTDGFVRTSMGVRDAASYSSVLQPDGKIVLGGYSYPTMSSSYLTLVRYSSSGIEDDTFGINGIVQTIIGGEDGSDTGYAIALQPDGKLIIGGVTNDANWIGTGILARYINDEFPPQCQYNCPENISVESNPGDIGVVVEYELSYDCNNNEDEVISVLIEGLPSGSIFPIGDTTVKHNLIFNGEIIATCSFIVKVEEGQLGVSDNSYNEFMYYPNPVKDILNISYNGEISNMAIFDLSGKQVYNSNINNNKAQVNVAHLATGVYIVKAKVNGDIKTFKIVKK